MQLQLSLHPNDGVQQHSWSPAVTPLLTHMGTRQCGEDGSGDKDEQCWGPGNTTLGHTHLQHPKSKPWEATALQPVSGAHSRGSQPLWCPGCWLGSAWQAHGFPSTRTLDQLCSLRWVGRGEDMFHKPHGHWNKAARVFCPGVIRYTALRSHAGSG